MRACVYSEQHRYWRLGWPVQTFRLTPGIRAYQQRLSRFFWEHPAVPLATTAAAAATATSVLKPTTTCQRIIPTAVAAATIILRQLPATSQRNAPTATDTAATFFFG